MNTIGMKKGFDFNFVTFSHCTVLLAKQCCYMLIRCSLTLSHYSDLNVSKSNKRFVKNCLVLGQVQYFSKTQYSVILLFILFTVFVQLLLFRDFPKKYNKFFNLWSVSYIFFTSEMLLIVKITLDLMYSGSYQVGQRQTNNINSMTITSKSTTHTIGKVLSSYF